MPGELQGTVVIVNDEREANRIYNKGYPGVPQSGGGLKLGLLEAAFLMDEKGLDIQRVGSVVELIHHAAGHITDFGAQYLVYRELKLRGFFVRIPDQHFHDEIPRDRIDYFRLLPRGSGPSVPASIYVLPISERDVFSLEGYLGFTLEAKEKGIEALAGVVDEDGDVTFYTLGTVSPIGDYEMVNTLKLTGKPGQNRVLVPLDENAKLMHHDGFFGRIVGTTLHLSLIEANYLRKNRQLEIESKELEDFEEWAERVQPDFSLRYPVYRQLRNKGMRVKTGFKYGTHFRAYTSDPDSSHADYLVHVHPSDHTMDWQEISRGIRVAHGVNKRVLFTSPELADKNEFLELAWVRP